MSLNVPAFDRDNIDRGEIVFSGNKFVKYSNVVTCNTGETPVDITCFSSLMGDSNL